MRGFFENVHVVITPLCENGENGGAWTIEAQEVSYQIDRKDVVNLRIVRKQQQPAKGDGRSRRHSLQQSIQKSTEFVQRGAPTSIRDSLGRETVSHRDSRERATTSARDTSGYTACERATARTDTAARDVTRVPEDITTASEDLMVSKDVNGTHTNNTARTHVAARTNATTRTHATTRKKSTARSNAAERTNVAAREKSTAHDDGALGRGPTACKDSTTPTDSLLHKVTTANVGSTKREKNTGRAQTTACEDTSVREAEGPTSPTVDGTHDNHKKESAWRLIRVASKPRTYPSVASKPLTSPSTADKPLTYPFVANKPLASPSTADKPLTYPFVANKPLTYPSIQYRPHTYPFIAYKPHTYPFFENNTHTNPSEATKPLTYPAMANMPLTIPSAANLPYTYPSLAYEPLTRASAAKKLYIYPFMANKPYTNPSTASAPEHVTDASMASAEAANVSFGQESDCDEYLVGEFADNCALATDSADDGAQNGTKCDAIVVHKGERGTEADAQHEDDSIRERAQVERGRSTKKENASPTRSASTCLALVSPQVRQSKKQKASRVKCHKGKTAGQPADSIVSVHLSLSVRGDALKTKTVAESGNQALTDQDTPALPEHGQKTLSGQEMSKYENADAIEQDTPAGSAYENAGAIEQDARAMSEYENAGASEQDNAPFVDVHHGAGESAHKSTCEDIVPFSRKRQHASPPRTSHLKKRRTTIFDPPRCARDDENTYENAYSSASQLVKPQVRGIPPRSQRAKRKNRRAAHHLKSRRARSSAGATQPHVHRDSMMTEYSGSHRLTSRNEKIPCASMSEQTSKDKRAMDRSESLQLTSNEDGETVHQRQSRRNKVPDASKPEQTGRGDRADEFSIQQKSLNNIEATVRRQMKEASCRHGETPDVPKPDRTSSRNDKASHRSRLLRRASICIDQVADQVRPCWNGNIPKWPQSQDSSFRDRELSDGTKPERISSRDYKTLSCLELLRQTGCGSNESAHQAKPRRRGRVTERLQSQGASSGSETVPDTSSLKQTSRDDKSTDCSDSLHRASCRDGDSAHRSKLRRNVNAAEHSLTQRARSEGGNDADHLKPLHRTRNAEAKGGSHLKPMTHTSKRTSTQSDPSKSAECAKSGGNTNAAETASQQSECSPSEPVRKIAMLQKPVATKERTFNAALHDASFTAKVVQRLSETELVVLE